MRAIRVLVVVIGLAGSLLPALPAAATHPCVQSEDGRSWDGVPGHNHDGCSGGVGYPAVTVGPSSDGTTVTVRVGETVFVHLASQEDERWSDIDVPTDGALFRVRMLTGTDATTAVFRAERVSDSTRIVATTDPACRHADPACATPTRSWSVTVVVTEGTPSGDGGTCRAQPRGETPPGSVDVLESQAGSTVTIRVGSRLRVFLRRCEAGGGYRLPASAADGPLFREHAVLQQPGSASAVLLAVRTGTTTVTAAPDAPCRHRQPACAPLTGTWSVTVRVVEATPDGSPPPCVTMAIPSDSDYAFPGVTTVAGRPVTLAFGAPSDSSTVTLTRTSPEPRAVVRQGAATARRIEWSVSPTVNTALEATSPDSLDDCPRVVRRVFVAPSVSLTARRNAPRDYTFSGRVFPARGQRVSLYRTPSDGSGRVLTAQGVVAPDGTYRVDRRFLGSGQFVLYADVSPSSSNTAGASRGRPTVVH